MRRYTIADNRTWTVESDPDYPCRDCDRIYKDNCICPKWRMWFGGEYKIENGRKIKLSAGVYDKVCAPLRELKKGE